MGTQIGQLRQVIVPTQDVAAAVAHYRDLLGLEVRFQDGERWAALDAGGFTLALAGPGEHPADGEIALAVKVADLEGAISRLLAAGGQLVAGPLDGEHERRATCRDRFGTLLALYTPST